MKKILCFIIVICLFLTCSVTVFAGHSTKVRYVGTGDSEWELDVPIQLAPGESGNVILGGTWDSNTIISVSADETVTLNNDVDESTKTLNVNFDTFSTIGNMDSYISVTKEISVANIMGAIFGTWEGVFNYYLTVDTERSNNKLLNHSGTIPEGATYYVGVEPFMDNCYGTGDYAMNTEVLTVGDNFPEPQVGDVYVYDDCEYRYNAKIDKTNDPYWHVDESLNGWAMIALDDTKSEYKDVLESIAGKNIVYLSHAFEQFSNLTVAPKIPNTVTHLDYAFAGVPISIAPILPQNLVSMDFAFTTTNIVVMPEIPESVKYMNNSFAACYNLTTASSIPSSVVYAYEVLAYCTKLTGEVEINSNDFGFGGMFIDTVLPITLIGTSTILEDIAVEYENVTVSSLNAVKTFTFCSITYIYEDGMTWGDWIESRYNTYSGTIALCETEYDNLLHFRQDSSSTYGLICKDSDNKYHPDSYVYITDLIESIDYTGISDPFCYIN